MDDTYVKVDGEIEADWSVFYPEVKKGIPLNAREPRVKAAQTIVFIDAKHAGDSITRRSRTGILLYVNIAPIDWYTKKQGSKY
jgi:hypothetical protein